MCLIVDCNSFSHVFNIQDQRHAAFAPVFNWVFFGNGGGLIYGGAKYKKEISFSSETYRALFVELNRKGRMFEMCGQCVDHVAKSLKKALPNEPDFDDEHIVALVIVSKCHIVCTEEHRGLRFWKRRELYPKGTKPPLIYRSDRNANLLANNRNIADVCRSGAKMTCRNTHS